MILITSKSNTKCLQMVLSIEKNRVLDSKEKEQQTTPIIHKINSLKLPPLVSSEDENQETFETAFLSFKTHFVYCGILSFCQHN